MKHIRLFMTALAVFVGLGAATPTLAPAVLAATPKSTVCQTLGSDSGCDATPNNGANLNKVITTIVNILSIVVGVAAVIMIMVGGFRYVTSGGDSNNVTSAKNTILYAVIGLIIVGLAQAIVQFVLKRTA